MKRNSDRYKSNRVGKSTAREDRKRSLFEKDRDRKEDVPGAEKPKKDINLATGL
jgi:hypothetical protein